VRIAWVQAQAVHGQPMDEIAKVEGGTALRKGVLVF
jgi:hypothetical protein